MSYLGKLTYENENNLRTTAVLLAEIGRWKRMLVDVQQNGRDRRNSCVIVV